MLRILICIVTLGSMVPKGTAQEEAANSSESELGRIRERYKQIQKELNQLYISWSTKRRLLVSPELASKLSDTGGKVNSYVEQEIITAFKGSKRYYDENFRPVNKEGPPLPNNKNHLVMTYDGEFTKVYDGFDEKAGINNKMKIFPGDKTSQFVALDTYLAYHGLPKTDVPSLRKRLGVHALPDAIAGNDARVVGTEILPNGITCVRVDAARSRFWFDPKHGFALCKREWFNPESGHTTVRAEFLDPLEVQTGIWLNRRLLLDLCSESKDAPNMLGKPYLQSEVSIKEIRTNPIDDTLFSYSLKPGTLVQDMTLIPKRERGFPVVSYVVPTRSADLDKVRQTALNDYLQDDRVIKSRTSWSRWLMIGNAILLAVGAGMLWLRLRRRTSSAVA